jgi:hypothetical protein
MRKSDSCQICSECSGAVSRHKFKSTWVRLTIKWTSHFLADLKLSSITIYTKDENPGNGALDLALLFITIWPPLRMEAAAEEEAAS